MIFRFYGFYAACRLSTCVSWHAFIFNYIFLSPAFLVVFFVGTQNLKKMDRSTMILIHECDSRCPPLVPPLLSRNSPTISIYSSSPWQSSFQKHNKNLSMNALPLPWPPNQLDTHRRRLWSRALVMQGNINTIDSLAEAFIQTRVSHQRGDWSILLAVTVWPESKRVVAANEGCVRLVDFLDGGLSNSWVNELFFSKVAL